MLSIQIISLIIFVIGIVVMPVVDQLFFYSAFNFKGGLNATAEKEQLTNKENVTSKTLQKENNAVLSNDINKRNAIPPGNERIVSTDDGTRKEPVRSRMEERVNVERPTVDRPATSADFHSFEERDIEMVERAEIPVISREARVVEEVRIDKEIEERNENIQDTVRKTDVDVERFERGI